MIRAKYTEAFYRLWSSQNYFLINFHYCVNRWTSILNVVSNLGKMLQIMVNCPLQVFKFTKFLVCVSWHFLQEINTALSLWFPRKRKQTKLSPLISQAIINWRQLLDYGTEGEIQTKPGSLLSWTDIRVQRNRST